MDERIPPESSKAVRRQEQQRDRTVDRQQNKQPRRQHGAPGRDDPDESRDR